MNRTLLQVSGLTKRFGPFTAVDDVSLTLVPGERRAIIGPNGAGKTTLIEMISGRLHPNAGRILFAGEDITGWPTQRRARAGLVRTFQRGGLFPRLTVREHLDATQAAGRLRLRRGASHSRVIRATLERYGLQHKSEQQARELSHGDRRLLELAMALALRPQLLLLDEPTAGLSQAETRYLIEILAALSEVTLLIVEHDMDVVFRLAERITLMHEGRVLVEGSPEEIGGDARVQEVYLGRSRC